MAEETPAVAESPPETPAAPAPAPEAPVQVQVVPPPRAPRANDARDAMRRAFREARTASGTPENAVQSTPAAVSERPPAESPAATAPVASSAPEPVRSEPAAEAPAPPAAPTQPSPSEEPPEAKAPETPEAPKPRPPLPAEFQRELEALSVKDPSLRRSLSRIWNDPNRSEVDKIREMGRKTDEARAAPTPATPQQRMANAAREGRYEDLANETLSWEQQEIQQQKSFALASEILADVLGIDPEDNEYLQTATKEGLQDLIERRSPRILNQVARRTQTIQTEHEAALAAQKKQYEDQIAEINARHKEELEARVTEATARAQAGRPRPPGGFSTNGTVIEGGGPPNVPDARDVPGAVRLRRGLLSAGYRQQTQNRG